MASFKSNRQTYTIRPATPSNLPRLPSIEASAGTLFASIPGLEHLASDQPMSERAHQESLDRWRDGPLHRGENGQDGGTWIAVLSDEDSASDRVNQTRSHDEKNASSERPVGFIVTEVLPVIRTNYTNGEGKAEGYFMHISELSISLDHQRRGLAGRLLRSVKEFARSFSLTSVTNSPHAEDQNGRPQVLGLSLTTFRNVPFNRPFYEKFGFRVVESDVEVDKLCGLEGTKIWKEDRERFEGSDGGDSEKITRRCWMVCEF